MIDPITFTDMAMLALGTAFGMAVYHIANNYW